MDVDKGESSNGDFCESNDSENEEELESTAEALEKQIAENIFSYQSHVDLINVLKKLTDLDRLRIARNRMAMQFPLTPELWLDWLEDEIKIASSAEEKQNILKLFERAVKDYLSVEIWLKYLEFAMDFFNMKNESEVSEVRKICECSLTNAGLHITKGSDLWHSYIEFEKRVLALFPSDSDAYKNQLKYIANLYKRLLSCPLIDIEENVKKFNSWFEKLDDQLKLLFDKSLTEDIYKKSKDKFLKISVYEDALISDPDQTLEHYKDYLSYEKSKLGSPVRVQFLYERMLCEFCLNEDIWLDYINYASTILNNGNVVIEIIHRAIRNCPWSSRLHQCHIRSLEKYHHNHKTITGAFEQAVASGLQTVGDFRDMWMCYLEYLRRRFDEPEISRDEEEKRIEELRDNFIKASEFLNQLDGSDPECIVQQFWARIEAIYCRNMEKSRSLWNDILSSDKTSDMWLEYIHIERTFGDSKHLRKLYSRALQNTNDFPEKIAKSWLNYERDEGTLESYDNCVEKIQIRLNEIKVQREREELKRHEKEQAQVMIKKKSKRAGSGIKENFTSKNCSEQENNKNLKGFKRKSDNETEETLSSQKKSKKEETDELVTKLLEENDKSHGVTVVHDSSKDDRTVFVSNLDFSTQESAIQDIFSNCGPITDLRLVRDYKGRSKGYCYVEFEKPEYVTKALKKDRELIKNRPMFVSKCDPDKQTRGSGFKYSSSLEKNKLFIRGLPYSTTENDLKEIFGKYGSLKDVRLVTYRNGHSKGLAYVDYEDEVSAAQAIIKTDGMTIGDRQISVAISNPPDRKIESVNKISCLGGGLKEMGPRGRGRTQLSMVPRSVLVSQQSPTTNSMANLTLNTPQPQPQPFQASTQLNNYDFKKMVN